MSPSSGNDINVANYVFTSIFTWRNNGSRSKVREKY